MASNGELHSLIAQTATHRPPQAEPADAAGLAADDDGDTRFADDRAGVVNSTLPQLPQRSLSVSMLGSLQSSSTSLPDLAATALELPALPATADPASPAEKAEKDDAGPNELALLGASQINPNGFAGAAGSASAAVPGIGGTEAALGGFMESGVSGRGR